MVQENGLYFDNKKNKTKQQQKKTTHRGKNKTADNQAWQGKTRQGRAGQGRIPLG